MHKKCAMQDRNMFTQNKSTQRTIGYYIISLSMSSTFMNASLQTDSSPSFCTTLAKAATVAPFPALRHHLCRNWKHISRGSNAVQGSNRTTCSIKHSSIMRCRANIGHLGIPILTFSAKIFKSSLLSFLVLARAALITGNLGSLGSVSKLLNWAWGIHNGDIFELCGFWWMSPSGDGLGCKYWICAWFPWNCSGNCKNKNKITHSGARLAYPAYEKHTSLLICMRKWAGWHPHGFFLKVWIIAVLHWRKSIVGFWSL